MPGLKFTVPDNNHHKPASRLFPVSWLQMHGYCEYLLFMVKVGGIETPPTDEMLSGARQHARLDTEHAQQADLHLTLPEAARKSRTESLVLISRDVPVRGKTLFGRIDEIIFEPGRIIIIDDKPGAKPYFSNKIQVWGYCQAFHQAYAPELPLFGSLREETGGKIVWLEQYTPAQDALVNETVARIKNVLEGLVPPEPIGNIRKCRSCRIKDSCPAVTRS